MPLVMPNPYQPGQSSGRARPAARVGPVVRVAGLAAGTRFSSLGFGFSWFSASSFPKAQSLKPNAKQCRMPNPQTVRRGEYAARGDYHRYARSLLGLLPDVSREADGRAALSGWAARAARACSTRDAAKGCIVDEYAGAPRYHRARRQLRLGPGHAGIAHGAALPGRVVRSRAVSRRARAPGLRRAAARARRDVPRAPPGRRAVRLGPQPRPPAIAHPVPAARALDPHRIRIQASRRSSRRRIPPARAACRVHAAPPARHLPDGPGR